MTTQYCTATSLDGYIATEDDSLDWLFPLGEAIVPIASVTLGRGKPLFPRRVTSPPWQLLSVCQFASGFAERRYRLPPAGADAASGDRPREAP